MSVASITVSNLKRIQFKNKIEKLKNNNDISQVDYNNKIHELSKLCFYGDTNRSISNYNQLIIDVIFNQIFYKVYVRAELVSSSSTHSSAIESNALRLLPLNSNHIDIDGSSGFQETMMNNQRELKFAIGITSRDNFKPLCNKLRNVKDLMIIVLLYGQATPESSIIHIGSYQTPKFIAYSRFMSSCHEIIDDVAVETLCMFN